MLLYPKPDLQGFSKCDRGAMPGFPVQLGGALHAAFLKESRTRGRVQWQGTGNPGRPIVFGPGNLGTRPIPFGLAMTQTPQGRAESSHGPGPACLSSDVGRFTRIRSQEGEEDGSGEAAAGGVNRLFSPPLCSRCTIAFSNSFW
jgi:hypothetical protein